LICSRINNKRRVKRAGLGALSPQRKTAEREEREKGKKGLGKGVKRGKGNSEIGPSTIRSASKQSQESTRGSTKWETHTFYSERK